MKTINNLLRKNIQNLIAYSCARDEFKGKDAVFLDANENPFGELNRYPDPYQQELKESIARVKRVDKKNVFVGNGSDEAIDLIFRMFCNPGTDKAIICPPTYGMYKVSADINDVEIVEIPLKENFQLDVKGILENSSGAKLIFLCSPNNPTGNLLYQEDIEKILNSFEGIVVMDEAYIDFSSAISWNQKVNEYPNLIVLQTLSKAWGLANIRCGMAFASEEIIQVFNKVKPPYNVNGLTQDVALKALKNQEEHETKKAIILSEREKLKVVLENLRIVEKVFESDANFLLIKIEESYSIYTDLLERNLVVRNRSSVIPSTLRISIGTKEENDQLVKELKRINDEKSIVYR